MLSACLTGAASANNTGATRSSHHPLLACQPCLHVFTPTTRRFSNVCELDIMFSLETTHHIIDEMIANGCIVETNKANALTPVQLLERVS